MMSRDQANGNAMAEIFISYTAADRDWAFWIGLELEKLGQVPHVHEWEIGAGGDRAPQFCSAGFHRILQSANVVRPYQAL